MTVGAIERCVAIVECLAGEPDGLELGVVAARLDLPKSAAHRILATLATRGWVAQESPSGNYVLSLRFPMLAFRDLDARVITESVQRVLDDLARRTREYCRIAVVEGETLTWVARAQGAVAGLRYDADMGVEVTLHATATGKAWLASLSEASAMRIVRGRNLERGGTIGPNAACTEEAVLRALDETRSRGYATAFEEAEPGIHAVAVAFRAAQTPDAPVAGTISIAGPASRMGDARMPELVTALRESAGALEELWRLRKRSSSRTATAQSPRARDVEPAAAR